MLHGCRPGGQSRRGMPSHQTGSSLPPALRVRVHVQSSQQDTGTWLAPDRAALMFRPAREPPGRVRARRARGGICACARLCTRGGTGTCACGGAAGCARRRDTLTETRRLGRGNATLRSGCLEGREVEALQASSIENSASESPHIRVAARPSGTTETRPSTRPPCAALAARARTRMRRGEPAERPRAAAAGGSPSDDDDQLHRILTRRSSGGLRELRSRCSSLCALQQPLRAGPGCGPIFPCPCHGPMEGLPFEGAIQRDARPRSNGRGEGPIEGGRAGEDVWDGGLGEAAGFASGQLLNALLVVLRWSAAE